MDYRYLKAFILTAHYSSFSKAAEKLNIAQSAVSRQIKLLEDSIDEELIIRSSKKVILTNKGQEFFMAAQQFDQIVDDIFSREDDRELRIGILQGLLKNWFRPILLQYLKTYQRNISIKVAGQNELRHDLEAGKYDLIFTTENIQSDLTSSLKLFNERLSLISTSEVNRKKLYEYRWIVYGDDDYLYQLSPKKRSQSIVKVESLQTIVELVKNDLGIAVVPNHILQNRNDLIVNEVTTLQKSEIFLSTLNFKSMPGHIREIAEIVQSSTHM